MYSKRVSCVPALKMHASNFLVGPGKTPFFLAKIGKMEKMRLLRAYVWRYGMSYPRNCVINNKNGLSLPLNIFATLLAAKCKSKLEQLTIMRLHAWYPVVCHIKMIHKAIYLLVPAFKMWFGSNLKSFHCAIASFRFLAMKEKLEGT